MKKKNGFLNITDINVMAEHSRHDTVGAWALKWDDDREGEKIGI